MEIASFKIDKRHRKAYIASNTGIILVINATNGVVIKNVTQYIEDQKNIELNKKDPHSTSLTSLGSSNASSRSGEEENNIYNDTPPRNKSNRNMSVSALERKEIEIESKTLRMQNKEFE